MSINWGDGTMQNPDITGGALASQGGGVYAVEGLHTYTTAGSYPISVTVNDAGGQSANTASTATVGNSVFVNDNWYDVTDGGGALHAGDTVSTTDPLPPNSPSTFTYDSNAFDHPRRRKPSPGKRHRLCPAGILHRTGQRERARRCLGRFRQHAASGYRSKYPFNRSRHFGRRG